MVQVKALINYNDKELDRAVTIEEIFEVTEERANVLVQGNASSNNKPFVEIIAAKKPTIKIEKADKKKNKVETANVELQDDIEE